MIADPPAFLRRLFDAAVARADPMRVIPEHLGKRPEGRVLVIGAGKASARMAEAVEQVWGACEGLVITRYGYARPCQGIEIVEAAHPVPDAAGEAATKRLLGMVAALGADDHVLCLISGGGSALLTAPAPGLSLDDKMAVNSALLASGAPIGAMNVVRKHLSRVKGGQLAAAAYPARMLALMISDVPGDDPAAIASGPTVGEASTPAEARAIIERYRVELPDSARVILGGETGVIPVGDPRLSTTENRIIAAPAQSLDEAREIAEREGLDVRLLGDSLEGEACDLGREHARAAMEIAAGLAEGAAPVLLMSGGECTVTRRGDGIGGPNAEYALAAGIALDGHPGISLIACDTDGVDGAAEVAGALVTPDMTSRATASGLDPEAALARNDAHSFFGAIGAQVVTGPTLTNVNDFRAILIQPG